MWKPWENDYLFKIVCKANRLLDRWHLAVFSENVKQNNITRKKRIFLTFFLLAFHKLWIQAVSTRGVGWLLRSTKRDEVSLERKRKRGKRIKFAVKKSIDLISRQERKPLLRYRQGKVWKLFWNLNGKKRKSRLMAEWQVGFRALSCFNFVLCFSILINYTAIIISNMIFYSINWNILILEHYSIKYSLWVWRSIYSEHKLGPNSLTSALNNPLLSPSPHTAWNAERKKLQSLWPKH